MNQFRALKHFRRFKYAAAVLIALLLLPLRASAEVIEVSDLRFWSYPDYTRVAVTMSGRTEFTKNRLSNPDRLYFDIKNSRIKKELLTDRSVGNGMLKAVRAGQFNENTVRVVLDLDKIKDYKIVSFEDPIRLIIDIYGYAEQPTASAKKRIVIDAGHGGHDPGAVGPNKLYEKNVVLDIALKLKKLLSESPNLEVFLTRDKDVFIPLEERTAIANSKNADLFVSVHANASPSPAAKGIETYLLNWTNDEEAMKVAARENRISLKKMKSLQKERSVLDVMLGDLSRDFKRDESVKLANLVQKSMIGGLNREYGKIIDHGVKQAYFYVLLGAQMPSVLVEVSFISNPDEEKRLASDEYRGDIAKNLANGISKYMSFDGQYVAGSGKTGVGRN